MLLNKKRLWDLTDSDATLNLHCYQLDLVFRRMRLWKVWYDISRSSPGRITEQAVENGYII